MASTIVATPGAANANSYGTVLEAGVYFGDRSPLSPSWDSAADSEAMLIMATRLLDALLQPFKIFVPSDGFSPGYYRVRRHWTGAPATTTQRLAWPRIGMYDRNGNAIASNVIPQELKEAQFELAGQLLKTDRTLDNDVAMQGITSVKAGSLAVTFKEADMILKQVLPDAVYDLLVQSWLTDELILPAMSASFEVI